MSPKTEKITIIITVFLSITLFGALSYHNIKYLSIHLFGDKKDFHLTSTEYYTVQPKHRRNYSDKPFTHAVTYYVEYNDFKYPVFSEAKIANSEHPNGEPFYKERVGEQVTLYYLNYFGISEGSHKNLNFNIGAFFFLVFMEFCLIVGVKIQYFNAKKNKQ